MSKQLRLLPAFIMLLAGAVTSIITFAIGYSFKSALIILLFVLIFFYILGLVLQKLIFKFEEANKPKPEEEEKKDEEGTVVEKDESEVNKNPEAGVNAEAGNRPEIDK